MSYGTEQPVATIAKRALSNVQMHYSVNGGRTHSAGVAEWKGGERYGDTHDDYYAELRGTVTGTEAGDEVEVWFSGRKRGAGRVTSEHFTYKVHDDIGGEVLILAVEDVTGISPAQPGFTSAKYADEMAAALTAAGRTSDVYDFDTQGRKAPHHLGVLSHYEAVLWETGDDIILRAPGQVGGTTMKAALDIELSVRDYLNEGGKALVSGKYALFAQAANGALLLQPVRPAGVHRRRTLPVPAGAERLPAVLAGRLHLHRRWRHRADGSTYPLTGIADPYTGWDATLDDEPGPHRVVPADVELPAAGGVPVVRAELGPGRLGPAGRRAVRAAHWRLAPVQRAGRRVVQAADPDGRPHRCHHRAASVLHLLRDGGRTGTSCSSRRTRSAPTTWTTLPDVNGHTGTDTGESCPEGWNELHPFLDHYQGADCSPTGTTGSWNAATGTSAGSEEWVVDLSAYAGKQVELSISYVSDWATQGLGVFLDDVSISTNGACRH